MSTLSRIWPAAKSILDVAASIAALSAVVLLITNRPAASTSTSRPSAAAPLSSAPLAFDPSTAIGSHTARVALIEYTDFECPFCARFTADALPQILREYVSTGRILFIVRHKPLPMHPHAVLAASAAVCASRGQRAQEDSLEVHDWLFRNTKQLDQTQLLAFVKERNINVERFTECLASDAVEQLKADEASAAALQLRSTPSFIVARVATPTTLVPLRRLVGAQRFPAFAEALDAALKQQR